VVASLALGLTVRPDWGHVCLQQTPSIPFLPPDIRALGLKNNLVEPTDDNGLTRRIRAAIAAHEGPIWSVVDSETRESVRDAVLAAYRLVVFGDCW
jgi:hypothetical protein